MWGDANAISEIFTESVPGITLALNNLKDIDVLYCGSYVGQVISEWGIPDRTSDVFMLYKDNRAGSETVGQYCIYTFQFAYDFELWINKAIPKIERAFPAAFQYAIREDGQFFVSPAGQYEFLFFSSGASHSELWGYIFRGTGGTDRSSCLTSEIGNSPISSTDAGNGGSSMGMDLTVALETGEIYMFNVNNSHFGTVSLRSGRQPRITVRLLIYGMMARLNMRFKMIWSVVPIEGRFTIRLYSRMVK